MPSSPCPTKRKAISAGQGRLQVRRVRQVRRVKRDSKKGWKLTQNKRHGADREPTKRQTSVRMPDRNKAAERRTRGDKRVMSAHRTYDAALAKLARCARDAAPRTLPIKAENHLFCAHTAGVFFTMRRYFAIICVVRSGKSFMQKARPTRILTQFAAKRHGA